MSARLLPITSDLLSMCRASLVKQYAVYCASYITPPVADKNTVIEMFNGYFLRQTDDNKDWKRLLNKFLVIDLTLALRKYENSPRTNKCTRKADIINAIIQIDLGAAVAANSSGKPGSAQNPPDPKSGVTAASSGNQFPAQNPPDPEPAQQLVLRKPLQRKRRKLEKKWIKGSKKLARLQASASIKSAVKWVLDRFSDDDQTLSQLRARVAQRAKASLESGYPRAFVEKIMLRSLPKRRVGKPRWRPPTIDLSKLGNVVEEHKERMRMHLEDELSYPLR